MGCGLTIKDGNGVVVQPSLTTPPLIDNRALRADGTGGKYQDSQVEFDDNGSITSFSENNFNNQHILKSHASGASVGSRLELTRSQGTNASPTAVQSSDRLGEVRCRGYSGSGFLTGAISRALANETFTASAAGTRLEFYTVLIGSTAPVLAFRILDTGVAQFQKDITSLGNITVSQTKRIDFNTALTTSIHGSATELLLEILGSDQLILTDDQLKLGDGGAAHTIIGTSPASGDVPELVVRGADATDDGDGQDVVLRPGVRDGVFNEHGTVRIKDQTGTDVLEITGAVLDGKSLQRLTNFIGHDKLFDAYDGTGGQTINGSAATVNIDTTRTNTDSNVFAIASDVVTVTQSGDGTAIIDYRVTIGTTGSGDFQFEVWLEQNNSEIAGSRVRAGKGT